LKKPKNAYSACKNENSQKKIAKFLKNCSPETVESTLKSCGGRG
jgi:hypothetical protein